MDKDLYEILGVKKDAKEGEIRKAFLKFAKKYHPDVNPGDKASELKFKEVNLAYEVLKDPKKRAQYDQMRAAGANPFAGAQQGAWRPGPSGPGAGGGNYSAESFGDFGLGDLFQEIFGGGGGGGFGAGGFGGMGGGPEVRTRRKARPGAGMFQRGADREAAISISFMEAARGGSRMLEMSDGKRLTVKIPEGVDNGSKIKLSGQGDPGMGGGPAGDLIITIEVQPHAYFEREGLNVVLKLPITFSEAVLGGEIEVPTLDGKVHLKIPAGVSSGQRLKLGGKGIQSAREGKRGDQFVELSIKIPRPPTDVYREQAEKLRGEAFNPRTGLF